jgi:glycosyltransferase involved in cell wall biosynthesis
MRCLWLTLADPDPPRNGQSIYSGGLIRSCADLGAEVVVLGLRAAGSDHRREERDGNIRWRIADDPERPRWSSATTPLPHMANRCATPGMKRELEKALDEPGWDAVVFDSISAAWALPAINRRFYNGNRPRIVYVSHNHEASLRRNIAESRPSFAMRQLQRLDAFKTRHIERHVIESSDLVTAITQEDGELYREEWPDKWIEVLSPGYSGRSLAQRKITSDVPRRAVIVGSFDWIAKRMNLEEFLRVADPIFASQGIELQVVGTGDQAYFDQLQSQLDATKFTGTVEHVEKYIDDARVAVLPERIGGGFKLKLLEYVFNRIPVLGLNGVGAGTPLRDDASILLYSSQTELARGVTRMIDNFSRLNQLQNAAYEACAHAFDWESRGRRLVNALGSS